MTNAVMKLQARKRPGNKEESCSIRTYISEAGFSFPEVEYTAVEEVSKRMTCPCGRSILYQSCIHKITPK